MSLDEDKKVFIQHGIGHPSLKITNWVRQKSNSSDNPVHISLVWSFSVCSSWINKMSKTEGSWLHAQKQRMTLGFHVWHYCKYPFCLPWFYSHLPCAISLKLQENTDISNVSSVQEKWSKNDAEQQPFDISSERILAYRIYGQTFVTCCFQEQILFPSSRKEIWIFYKNLKISVYFFTKAYVVSPH